MGSEVARDAVVASLPGLSGSSGYRPPRGPR